ILCERGIRTYEKATRNTLDISAVPVVQKLTHLPVIADPSHATGLRDMVIPMSLSIVAAGASGLVVEVHNEPEKALSDGPQSLYPAQFEKLMKDIQALAPVVGKSLVRTPRIHMLENTEKSADTVQSGEMTVAFQGEEGAFSERAVYQIFDQETKVLPCRSFAAAFEAVHSKQARYGVLPVENTLGGTINEVLDLLNSYPDLTVVGEKQIRIKHNLIGLPDSKIEDIRKVYSHPQGIAQCADFLTNELSHAEAVPFFDTAGAVTHLASLADLSCAAIASIDAAKRHHMKVLKEEIETNSRNYTRFYVLSREEDAQEFRSAIESDRVAMVFSVHDRPGSLFEVLKTLSDYGMNMKKLESRPIPGKPWEYSFFVEAELIKSPTFEKAIGEIEEHCDSFRVLGTFKGDRA
ncbi:MAG: prephenate dehydratase domain-containing protein, partial [Sphaerochaetaceae bacterium]|nr:prephenate dehydratase domain-containing protein [Sphaerochaetaceae bacterium]